MYKVLLDPVYSECTVCMNNDVSPCFFASLVLCFSSVDHSATRDRYSELPKKRQACGPANLAGRACGSIEVSLCCRALFYCSRS